MNWKSFFVFVGIVVCCTQTLWSQFSFGSPAVVTPTTNSITLCDSSPDGFFEVQWLATSALTDARLEVPLPAEIAYVNNSIADIDLLNTPADFAMVASFSNNLLVIEPGTMAGMVTRVLPQGASGTIRFKLKYDCSLIDRLSVPLTLPFQLVSDQGNSVEESAAINSSAALPQLNLVSLPTTRITNADLGGTVYNRSFNLVQSGQAAEVTSFNLCLSYEANIQASNQTLEGVTLTFPVAGGCLTIDVLTYPTLPWPLSQNESWVFAEDVVGIACNEVSSNAEVSLSCAASACQVPSRLGLSFELADSPPRIRNTRRSVTLNTPECIFDGAEVLFEYEATGKVYDASFRLTAGWQRMFIEPGSIEIDYGTGTFVPVSDFTSQEDAERCSGFYRADFDAPTAILDGSLSPQLIRVRYQINACCGPPDPNEENREHDYFYQAVSQVWYTDQCQTRERRLRTSEGGDIAGVDATITIPEYLDGGEQKTVRVDIDEFIVFDQDITQSDVCINIVVGGGLTLNVANGVRWSYAAPLHQAAIEDLGGGVYQACFDQSQILGRLSEIEFDLIYDCSSGVCGSEVSVNVELGVRMKPGVCTGPNSECLLVLEELSGTAQLGQSCCLSACDGAYNLGGEIQRQCFGEPDKDFDGCPDADGLLEHEEMRFDRGVKGDEMEIISRAEVLTSDGSTTFDYAWLRIDWPEATTVLPQGEIRVVDKGTGVEYRASVPINSLSSPMVSIAELSADGLAGQGTFPAGFKFSSGDTLELAARFYVPNNPGCDVEQIDILTDWFVSNQPNAVNTDQLRCNLQVPISYGNVGWTYNFSPRTSESLACGGIKIILSSEICTGAGVNGATPFPAELRRYTVPAEMRMDIPTGMTIDSVVIVRYGRFRATQNQYTEQTANVTAFTTVVGNDVVVDFTSFYQGCGNESAPLGGYQEGIEFYFSGACRNFDFMPVVSSILHYASCGGSFPVEEHRIDTGWVTNLRTETSTLALSASIADIQPVQNIARWNVVLQEVGGADAINTWAIVRSNTGAIIPSALEISGIAVPENNGVFELGNLGEGSLTNVEVLARFSSCVSDTLEVIVGRNCDGFPTSVADALSNIKNCGSEALKLSLEPQEPRIQMAIVEEPVGSITPCTPISYELALVNTANASVYEPFIDVTVPSSGGLTIVPGSVVANFPSPTNPTPADFTINLGAAVSITPTAAGDVYRFSLEGKTSELDAATSLGWDGLVEADARRRQINIRLDVETTCTNTRTDVLRFLAGGKTPCGADVMTLERVSQPITLAGIASTYSAELNLGGSAPINLCAAGSTLNLAGSITFDGLATGPDTLVVDLPTHLAYVDFNAVMPTQFATPVVVEETIAGGFIKQSILIGITPGAAPAQELQFEIEVQSNAAQTTCSSTDSIYLSCISDVSFMCGAQTCGTTSVIGRLADPVFIPLLYDELSLSEFEVILGCKSTEITIADLFVNNIGSEVSQGNFIVNFYIDTDGDGAPDAGASPIESLSLSQNIAAGSSEPIVVPPLMISGSEACQLIAELTSCGCSTSRSGLSGMSRPSGDGAQNLQTCLNVPVQVGCDNDPLATYDWSSIGDDRGATLSSTTQGQPVLTLPISVASGSVVTYVRTTTYGASCAIEDTIMVSVQDLIETRGDTVSVCVTEQGAMTGPTGMLNYQWSPSTGLGDATDPLSGVTPADVPTVYTLSYLTLDGCPAEFTQVVQQINCVDLELALAFRQNPSQVGDTVGYLLTLQNVGDGTATGVIVSSEVTASMEYESHSGDGVFDSLSERWEVSSLGAGEVATLELDYIATSGGMLTNLVEIIAADQPEDDSTPGNSVFNEDDMAMLCTGIDVVLDCSADSFNLTAPSGLRDYQWYQNGSPIAGATDASFSVSETALYSLSVEGQPASCEAEIRLPTCVPIGDYVWYDKNNDGLQDATDVPIANVRIILLATDGQTVIDETQSDANGAYLFPSVPEGEYMLQADLTTAPDGEYYSFVPQGAGSDTDSDVDENGISRPFVTSATGRRDLDIGITFDAALSVVNEIIRFKNLDNGNIALYLRIGVRNTGSVPLQNLALEADLASQFGNAFVGVYDAPRAYADGGFSNPIGALVDQTYDGGFGNPQLLVPDAFAPGGFGNPQTLYVYLAAEIDPHLADFPLVVQIFGSGNYVSPNGQIGAVIAVDDSDSGTDFYSTNPGAPGDQGSADDPTPIECMDLDIQVIENAAKACAGSPVKLEASVADSMLTYTWRAVQTQSVIAQGSPTYLNSLDDDMAVAVTATNLDTLRCVYNLEATGIVGSQLPPTLITPNADGYNDVFRMDCLDEHTGVILTVFNRWGDEVYHNDNYQNDWGGTAAGKELPVGTYYYLLEVGSLNSEPFKGYLSIER